MAGLELNPELHCGAQAIIAVRCPACGAPSDANPKMKMAPDVSVVLAVRNVGADLPKDDIDRDAAMNVVCPSKSA